MNPPNIFNIKKSNKIRYKERKQRCKHLTGLTGEMQSIITIIIKRLLKICYKQ